jgi:hypothetical protein
VWAPTNIARTKGFQIFKISFSIHGIIISKMDTSSNRNSSLIQNQKSELTTFISPLVSPSQSVLDLKTPAALSTTSSNSFKPDNNKHVEKVRLQQKKNLKKVTDSAMFKEKKEINEEYSVGDEEMGITGGGKLGMKKAITVKMPSIVPLPRKYPNIPFLQNFEDEKREREYERWYWKRNHKSWKTGLWFSLCSVLVYYLNFFIVYPFSSNPTNQGNNKFQTLSSRPDEFSIALCNCYTYCFSNYNYVADILFLILGNIFPIGGVLLYAKYAPSLQLGRIMHGISASLAFVLMTINICMISILYTSKF